MAADERGQEHKDSEESETKEATPQDTDAPREEIVGTSRLGILGEFMLVGMLVFAILFLFTFSHGKSQFSQTLKWQRDGWPQPREGARNWIQQHTMYAAQAAEDNAELIFYGDRAFELWRGTIHMEPDPRAHGGPQVFHSHFGEKYKAAIFAISGDATQHLMWRLQNGEAPAVLHFAKAIVLLVGSNDLTYASFQGDSQIAPAGNLTVARIFAIADVIHTAAPSAQILLLGLLPRGDQTLMPDQAMFSQPSKFWGTIDGINARLEAFAQRQGHVEFIDCRNSFLVADHSALNQDLMPDAVHPSTAGMEVLAQCIKPAVRSAIGH